MYDRDWQIQISFPNFSESKWRCSNVGKSIPKIQIVYLSSPTQKTHYSRKKILIILYGTEITAILAYFYLNLVVMACHGPLLPEKFRQHIFELYNTQNPIIHVELSSYHVQNALLKFLLPSLNLLTPKTLLVIRKFPHFLHITEISAILAYFCPNLIAMATPLAPLNFFVTIFEFTDTENLTSHAKIDSIFWTEL